MVNILWKNIKQSSALLFLLPILSFECSCSSFDELDSSLQNTDNSTQVLLEKAKSKLLAMGLDTLGMEDAGKYYLVENDILVEKQALLSNIETRQFSTQYVVPARSSVRIMVDNSISSTSGWVEAVKDVIEIYNENTGLKLSYVDTAPDILIKKGFIGRENVCAEGVFPVSDCKPGAFININNHFYEDIDGYLNHRQKVFLLMHEMGHNLGLRHSDCKKWGEEVNPEGMVLVPNTPEIDLDSFMNSGTCGYEWKGLSSFDKLTLETLWPYYYTFTIHFVDADVPDINVKQNNEYYLSRYLIPKKKGYVFSGWRNTLQAYSPFCYNSVLKMNRTLYATWRQPHGLTKEYVYTGEGENSVTFYLSSATPVTFTSKVNRALNSWYDLRKHEGTYSKLEKLNDTFCKTTLIIDMRNKEMWASDDVNQISRSATFMLEEGQYKLTSSITTKLGDQNYTESGRHGSVESIVEYY